MFHTRSEFLKAIERKCRISCDESAQVPQQVPHKANSKRTNYLQWDDYFMATALLSAKRSKDPVTQVGACIVDKSNCIVAIGYNGFPRNCSDNDFPWSKSTAHNTLDDKKLYVVHAEANAILNRNNASLVGTKLYTTLFPCNECTKLIIQSGISEIFYISNKYEMKVQYVASKRMLDAAGVRYWRYLPVQKQIIIDFDEIIRDEALALGKLDVEQPRTLKFDNVSRHDEEHDAQPSTSKAGGFKFDSNLDDMRRNAPFKFDCNCGEQEEPTNSRGFKFDSNLDDIRINAPFKFDFGGQEEPTNSRGSIFDPYVDEMRRNAPFKFDSNCGGQEEPTNSRGSIFDPYVDEMRRNAPFKFDSNFDVPSNDDNA